jgi:hypothetical protein
VIVRFCQGGNRFGMGGSFSFLCCEESAMLECVRCLWPMLGAVAESVKGVHLVCCGRCLYVVGMCSRYLQCLSVCMLLV